METQSRRRAFHSKVRSGCKTWARRVKCDEATPVCQRCIKAGKYCQGYSAATQTRSSGGQRSQLPALLPRTLIDIPHTLPDHLNATETERRFFHTFRVATKAGAAFHVSNFSPFWTMIAPRLAHGEDAVKHALVAFGAAYELSKDSRREGIPLLVQPGPNEPFDERQLLDSIIVRQYNKSIQKLRDCISSERPDRAITAAVCCLIFICVEHLRANYPAAIAHLQNGIRIIESSLDPESLFSPASLALPRPSHNVTQHISDDEVRALVTHFRILELNESLFSNTVPRRLATLFYRPSHDDDGSTTLPDRFASIGEAFAAKARFVSDALAFDWETSAHRGDAAYWGRLGPRRRQQCLKSRAAALTRRYETFLSDGNEALGALGRASGCVDMITLLCMGMIVDFLPIQPPYREGSAEVDVPWVKGRIDAIIAYAEEALEARRAVLRGVTSPLDFTTEVAVVAPLFFSFMYAKSEEQRGRILGVVGGFDLREGPWDSRSLTKLLRGGVGGLLGSGGDGKVVPPGCDMGWGGDRDFLSLLQAASRTATTHIDFRGSTGKDCTVWAR